MTFRLTRIQAIIAAALVALAVGLSAGVPVGAASRGPWLPPCPDEDASGPCYWDAQNRGNGIGRSFVVFDGRVFYVD